LEYYQKISKEAPQHLNKNGYLLFEAGFGQADDIEDILKTNGFVDTEIIQDLAGIDRVVVGKLCN
jgi:release factor glutamine methyltransferase